MPTQPQRPIPPHTSIAYDFCDVLDRIAQQKSVGPGWAKVIASAAVSLASSYFPQAAKAALGDQLVATHKSTAAQLPIAFKAAMTPADDFDRLGQQLADAARTAAMQSGADKTRVMQAVQAFIHQLAPVGGRATMTDSGDQSVVPSKKKQAPVDAFAAAFQGDLRSDMTPR